MRNPSRWVLGLLTLGSTLLGADAPLTPIPIGELFRPLAVNHASLSPDGKHLAAISTTPEGARCLLVLDLATRTPEILKDVKRIDVGGFKWVNDRELIFSNGADGRFAGGLFHAQLGRLREATQFNAYDLTAIVGVPRKRPNRALVHIIASGLEDARSRLVEMRTDVNTFIRGQSASRPSVVRGFTPPKAGTVLHWFAREDGELGYCLTYENKQRRLHRYEPAGDDWIPVELDFERYHVVEVDPDQNSLWVSHYEAGQGFLLQKFDLVAKTFDAPVWHDAAYDLSQARLHFSRQSGRLVALSYDQKRHFTKNFAEPFASAQAAVQRQFPDADVELLNFDDPEGKLLYHVHSPQDPGRIVLLDLVQKNMEVLSELAPWLQGRRLQPAQPVSYTTGDGLREEGYLTLPAGASASRKAPLIVLVHDGPWRRAVWSFDSVVQFLASRGYAVLQPNYRGSTGYLPAVSHDERFAMKKMLADVAAATRAGADLEMIDRGRLAIMGEGFGGFLAMAGACFEPDLYAGAISIHGVFDWEKLIKELSYHPANRPNYEIWRDALGTPGKDRAAFAEYSPLQQSASIKSPVFLAYRENPALASSEQGKKLAARLKEAGTPCQTFVLKSNFEDPRGIASNHELYRQIDAFLARHLREPATK